MPGNFTIYRSSAGSGKTHTLVKEYIRLAITGKDYAKKFAKILAITFTNKAAGEMKERVVKNLYTLKTNEKHTQHDAAYLADMAQFCNLKPEEIQIRASVVFATMLHNYHLLKITTIDKFTVSLVYSFARELKIDADHEIVTDIDEVIDAGVQLLLEQSGKDAELTNMFVDFLGFEMDEGNKFNVKNELKKFCSKAMNERGYEALELAREHSEQEFIEAGKLAAKKINELEELVKNKALKAINLIQENGLGKEDFYFKGAGNYSKLVTIAANGFSAIEDGTRVQEFISSDKKRWQSSLSGVKADAAKRIEQQLVEIFVSLFDLRKNEGRNYLVHDTVRKNAFSMALFKRLYDVILEYKSVNSIILLSEFTQLVSNVVASEPAPFIYERLGERVKNIFVDEFQDTSALQFTNLIPLMENSLATNDFVMVVGDAKQSIYRWRNGNVEQFVDLPRLPQNSLHNQPYRQNVFSSQKDEKNLPVNYRSLANVIDFNNKFFEAISKHEKFISESLTTAYKDVVQENLVTKPGGYIEFEVELAQRVGYPGEANEEAEENESEETIGKRMEFVLSTISTSLKNGYSYSDIAILVRVHNEGEELFAELRRNNIPVVSNQALSLRNSLEIKSITTFLKCTQHPRMLTDLSYFAFTFARFQNRFLEFEDKIASISKQGSLEGILKLFGLEFNRQAFDMLNLFEQLHYITQLLKLPADNAFLASFFELSFEFFKKHGSNSLYFIEWWSQKSHSFNLQTSQNSNSVKIVTIHKSKGLQYPVVIIPFLSAKVRSSDKYFWLNKVPGYKIKPLPLQYAKALGDTEWNTEYELEKARSAFDVLNVMYVAMTRAEEQLFCFTKINSGSIDKDPIALVLKEFGWLPGQNKFVKGQPVIRKSGGQNINIPTIKDASSPGQMVSWFTKLKVSSYMAANKIPTQDMRQKGIITHTIASAIQQANEVHDRVNKLRMSGLIGFTETEEYTQSMNAFFESDIFRELYAASIAQISEIEITDGKGNINRPDRVFVLPGNNAVVIDLKTGEEDAEYHEQVRQYLQLLTNAGYKAQTGWLYYFKTQQWIKVEL